MNVIDPAIQHPDIVNLRRICLFAALVSRADYRNHLAVAGVVLNPEVRLVDSIVNPHCIRRFVEREAWLHFPGHILAISGRDLAALFPGPNHTLLRGVVIDLTMNSRRLHAIDADALNRQIARELGVTTELGEDRKSTRLNSSHGYISYAVFCLKKKKKKKKKRQSEENTN